MSKRSRYTANEKYEILKAYEDGSLSLKDIASIYKVYRKTIREWIYRYEKYGIEGLHESKRQKKYSKELKEYAVIDYLSGKLSLMEAMHKYELSSTTVLRKWIKRHNGHRELKSSGKGMSQSMAKGRTTSLKERIEIVNYCIANLNDYQKAAETYQVSYQQVYQWVKKFELGGEEALKDGRGKKKDAEELTSEDRIRLTVKKLEAENLRLRAENAFLKKLKELERGLP